MKACMKSVKISSLAAMSLQQTQDTAIYVKNEENRGGFNETLAGESDSPEGQTTKIVIS